MKQFFKITLALVAVLGVTTSARAGWAEIPDAGQMLGTAQDTVGVGSLGFITGALIPSSDVDMYRITHSGGVLTARTDISTPGGAVGDPMLFLFNSGGVLLAWDDDGGAGLESFLSHNTGAGTYYLAISSFSNHAVTTTGVAGVGGTLVSWEGAQGFSQGNYRITLSDNVGYGANAVPEPGSMTLLGLGALGLVGYAWRRRQKAAVANNQAI